MILSFQPYRIIVSLWVSDCPLDNCLSHTYLQRTQVAVIVLNDFRRKILEDIFFHSPQKEG